METLCIITMLFFPVILLVAFISAYGEKKNDERPNGETFQVHVRDSDVSANCGDLGFWVGDTFFMNKKEDEYTDNEIRYINWRKPKMYRKKQH